MSTSDFVDPCIEDNADHPTRRTTLAGMLGVGLALPCREVQALAPSVLMLLTAVLPSLFNWLIAGGERTAADRRHADSLAEQSRLQTENLQVQMRMALMREKQESERMHAQLAAQMEQIKAQAALNDRASTQGLLNQILLADRSAGRRDGVLNLGMTRAIVGIVTDEDGTPLNLALSENADGKGSQLGLRQGRVLAGRGGHGGVIDGAAMQSLARAGRNDPQDAIDVPVTAYSMGLTGKALNDWFDVLGADLERSNLIRSGAARGPRANPDDYIFVAERRYSRAQRPTVAGADRRQAIFARRPRKPQGQALTSAVLLTRDAP